MTGILSPRTRHTREQALPQALGHPAVRGPPDSVLQLSRVGLKVEQIRLLVLAGASIDDRVGVRRDHPVLPGLGSQFLLACFLLFGQTRELQRATVVEIQKLGWNAEGWMRREEAGDGEGRLVLFKGLKALNRSRCDPGAVSQVWRGSELLYSCVTVAGA